MATKTNRLELRVDAETDASIARAAELLHTTKSAFVADAARSAALKALGRSNTTLMAPEVFDAMVASLHVPDPTPELDKELAGLRRVERR